MICPAARLVLILIWAATAAACGSAWFSRPWQSNDGLPNDTITGLAQTQDGYLWIATPVGLARFDGVRFEKAVEMENSVNCLAPASTGGIWFCSGLLRSLGARSLKISLKVESAELLFCPAFSSFPAFQ